MAVRFDGTAANYQSRSGGPNYNAAYTWSAWCKLVGSTGTVGIVFIVHNVDGSQSDYIVTGTGGTGVAIAVNGGAGGTGNLTEWGVGETHHFAMVRASATDFRLYKNGVQIGATVTYNVGTGRTVAGIGSGAAFGAAYGWNGHKFGEKMWDRALTAAEIVNEMRTLRPHNTTSLLTVWPGIGSTAANAAIDYSGNGRNWTNNGTIAVEDNGAGVSWGGSTLILPFVGASGSSYDGSLTDSLTFTDSLGGQAVLSGALSDAQTLSDSLSSRTTQGVSLSESLTLTDAESSQVVVGGALSDALTLLDAEGGQLVSGGAIDESLTLSDSLAGARALPADLSESLTLTDSTGGQAVLGGTGSESLILTDSTAGQAVLSGGLTETSTLSDSSGGQAVVLGILAESETLTDTLSGEVESAGTFAGSLSETLTLTDTFDSSVIVQGAVEEVLSLSDALSGEGGQDVTVVTTAGGGWLPKRHRGKDWKSDEERRTFWETLENEFTELVSPSAQSPAAPQTPFARPLASTAVLEAVLAGPAPIGPVPSAPAKDPGQVEDEEFFEMIGLVAELL